MKIKALLLEDGKQIPLWMPCPECHGKSANQAISCDRCGNTGEVPRYWTVERLEEKGYTECYSDELFITLEDMVYGIFGQNPPPPDWTDEAQQEYLDEWGIE